MDPYEIGGRRRKNYAQKVLLFLGTLGTLILPSASTDIPSLIRIQSYRANFCFEAFDACNSKKSEVGDKLLVCNKEMRA